MDEQVGHGTKVGRGIWVNGKKRMEGEGLYGLKDGEGVNGL